MFEVESTVSSYRESSKSMRTTIPSEVVKILHLEGRDTLVWTISAKNDEFVVTVSKK